MRYCLSLSMTRLTGSLLLAACACILVACSVGPDYAPPEVDTPIAYRSEYKPDDAVPMQPEWWRDYNDPQLDALIERAMANSPNLAAALARVDRAAAAVGIARSELFPQADFFTEAVRERNSGNTGGFFTSPDSRSRLQSAMGLEWEVDIWGRVRRLSEAALAEAQAQADAYAFASLIVQTSVAETYFRIRILDRSIEILEATVAGRYELLELAQVRQASGLGDDLELAQARTEWASAAAELEAFRRNRLTSQNALAVIVGSLPESFDITPDPDWVASMPASPSVVPSMLLERRPDIAEAERLVAAASELIGARQAEYFPRLQITGDVGFAANDASNWFTRNALFGSIGPSIEVPLFTGGRIKSRVAQAEAEYRELLELYREQVLDAFRQVEDSLASLHYLQLEVDKQNIAASAANTAASLAQQRYESGLVNYLEVVDTERIALATNLRLNQIEGEILNSQLALIRSLGGGWKRQREP